MLLDGKLVFSVYEGDADSNSKGLLGHGRSWLQVGMRDPVDVMLERSCYLNIHPKGGDIGRHST